MCSSSNGQHSGMLVVVKAAVRTVILAVAPHGHGSQLVESAFQSLLTPRRGVPISLASTLQHVCAPFCAEDSTKPVAAAATAAVKQPRKPPKLSFCATATCGQEHELSLSMAEHECCRVLRQ